MDRFAAVRTARERLPGASGAELAAYIERELGLSLGLTAVLVTLGNLQERDALDASHRTALAKIERWKAENPEEAKKLAATARRKEAARRRKAAKAVGDEKVVAVPVEGAGNAGDPRPTCRASGETAHGGGID